jgi:hypothetical protein
MPTQTFRTSKSFRTACAERKKSPPNPRRVKPPSCGSAAAYVVIACPQTLGEAHCASRSYDCRAGILPLPAVKGLLRDCSAENRFPLMTPPFGFSLPEMPEN